MQIHLIRHGEVDNPDDVVYADIPGFRLSARGRDQASELGRYLSARPLRRIVTSPLDRAVETANLVGAATGAGVITDRRLTEWGLGVRWRGATWKQLPTVFPGELETYLAHPDDLPFSPESLDQLTARMVSAIKDRLGDEIALEDEVAFVSHEDPIHAALLALTATTTNAFHRDKPVHSSVVTLTRDDGRWVESGRWAPGL
jgi:broad specificity phosphatase PhoE